MESNKEIEDLKNSIQMLVSERFPSSIVNSSIEYDFPVFEITRNSMLEVFSYLKNAPETGFNFLTTMAASHYPDNKDREFVMMYQLHNLVTNERARFKVFLHKDDLHLPSLTPLWPAANWMERQEYDFFGIKFTGHPNLVRILNMDEMNYYPMRKEYPLEDGSRDDKNDKMFGR